MGPGVDDLQAVGFRRDDVEFAAIGFDEDLSGLAGEFEIGDENAAEKIDYRESFFSAAHDEGEGAVGDDEDFVGLRDDGDGYALLKGGGVVNAEGGSAAIDDENEFFVGSGAGLDGFGAGFGAADNGARGHIDGEELVGGGRGGVGAITGGGEVDGKGQRAYRNALRDL